jgi:tRNA G26 N,N-dimethylase Trm1
MDHQNEEAAKCADSERKVIAEGKAEVLLSSARNVFYNPVQEFNRDLRYVHYWLLHWVLEQNKLILF